VPADLVADKIIEQAVMTERMGGHYGWGT
jgi:hypothetical protein